MVRKYFQNRNALAWVLLVGAGTLHVADEAAHNFLAFYNPLVRNLRESLGFWPMPTFPFWLWIGGLILMLTISLLLTPVVGRGGRIIRRVVIAMGVIMTVNALGHMLGSVYFGQLLPGFYSSPLLLLTSVWMVKRGLGKYGWESGSNTSNGV